MPDALSSHLSPRERKTAADRLWKVIAAVDERAPYSDIRAMLEITVREIEPFCAEYQEPAHG